MPYTQTAFSQAIFKMFENLDFWLQTKYTDLPHDAIKVYLFGGCAVHLPAILIMRMIITILGISSSKNPILSELD